MGSRFQHVRRAFQVARIVLRNILEIAIDRLLRRSGIPGPDRLRMMLEELSGSFLKFGQILSLQVDALPREYCDALLNLLDRVPPFSRPEVERVFNEELGRPPESVFKEFDYCPIASASIGQVHRAMLADGTPVAVKVQRPGIRDVFMRDAVLLRWFVRSVFFLRIRSLYFLRDPAREFNDWLVDELDYHREASYAEVLGRNARETPGEKVPAVYWDLTTSRLLTLEFLFGYSVMDYLRMLERGEAGRIEELKKIGFDPSVFVSNVINNFMSDAFRFGVFHADLHPANLLVMKNNVVGYVDFGIVASMTPEARRKQIELSLAYVRGKTDEIFNAFLNVCTFTAESNLAEFRRDLERRCRLWYREPAFGGVPHFSRSLTVAMIDLLAMCRYYGVLVDREMIKYIRSLFLVDGLVSRIAPGLDLAPQIRKLCEDFMARDARGKTLSSGAALTMLADLSGWLLAGPARLLHSMELMERRQMRLQTRSEKGPDRQEGLRLRVLVVGAVWVAVPAAAWAGGAWQTGPTFGALAVTGFWTLWTIWFLDLLRKLARD